MKSLRSTSILTPRRLVTSCLCLAALMSLAIPLPASDNPATTNSDGFYNVKNFGATGDGKTLDTAAINQAILAVNAAGGGTLRFPPGTYLSTSIHLKSNVTLELEHGSVILAAPETLAPYDPREPGTSNRYQDAGHSYWHDALIWGDHVENVSIIGPGLIYGKGLHRGIEANKYHDDTPPNSGDKAISLVNCHNVILRDFSVLHGGWFAILATGVDNFTIDNLKLDTCRDGMDIDCCHNVRIVNCSVNSPWDDGICLKSSYALGYVRATENVTIANCFVTGGLIEGTLLDGTFQTAPTNYAGRIGRIKFGTESNGGFKNITIANCVFQDSRGLAIESVDGGNIEDVTVCNLAMRNINNSPIFIRLGSRLRGPDNPPVGVIRRINLSDIVASGVNAKYGSIISGIPGHPIEDVRISNVNLLSDGGGTDEQAALTPPEKEASYPEPGMFGAMPSYAFFIRHAKAMEFSDATMHAAKDEHRPAFVLLDVAGARFQNILAQTITNVPAFSLENVTDFKIHQCGSLPDVRKPSVPKAQY